MICPSCGTQNAAGKKFCVQCGTPLARACASCGAPLGSDEKFCGECGTPVVDRSTAPVAGPPPPAPASERRLVSVLFADLVGFTALSETRDSEEVRDLLSRYFDTSRTLISRYGGTVEKFIGDAVMAVWGTPVAQEDDAERSVRAAMELVAAVAELGQEVGGPELNARAGVLTGEAAVTLGAEGQGMVAGDLVNTASRIQSAAAPGQVFVGESTRRSSEAAIAYEDAGTFEFKGKAEPVRLWRALRVVAAVGGVQRSAGLEPPFVGRDRELRLLKDLFHSSAEDRRAHLVSVTGAAGVGKSRLLWEFEKYVDGLAGQFRWHRGRCLAYGEGVTYWALAEMVRTRADIVEGEEAASALAKLRSALEASLPDLEERRWVEPRLAHLLGLEERVSREREDLFAAWRLFYERLSDEMPTVMVFEDMQWADAAMLDFIEYLLEWARDHRLFVITVARPDLGDRRPNWGTGRSSTSIYLDPLSNAAMEETLTGLVPGLPDDLRDRILERAEGIPLYAVETVRMLLDRGLLVQEENAYTPAGPIDALEVPETLHALIAARLDGLAPEERRLLQDASVLGKTFAKGALAAVSGLPASDLDALLISLTRKEALTVQADPRSPERGQYAFVQDLLRMVAYETLSKKERRARHLEVAAYLETTWGTDDDEVVEVVASHYLEAHRAAPDAPDAAEIKGKAWRMLARAGERAASLGASEEAERYFRQAAELPDEPAPQSQLLERAGEMAAMGGRPQDARHLFERSLELVEREGDTHAAARISARLGFVEWRTGQLDEAIERMERGFDVLRGDEPDEDLARLATDLGRLHFFRGEPEIAAERVAFGLQVAEALWLPELISQGLNTKGILAMWQSRNEESIGLLRHALEVAQENEIPSAALRAHMNLSETLARRDRYDDSIEQCQAGVALAHRVGDRFSEWQLAGNLMFPLSQTGRWDEAMEISRELPPAQYLNVGWTIEISALRGEVEEAARVFAAVSAIGGTADVQDRAGLDSAHAALLLAQGRYEEALAAGEAAFAAREHLGVAGEDQKGGFVRAVEAALALGDIDRADTLTRTVEELPPGLLPPYLAAQSSRFRARITQARGEADGVEAGFKRAAGTLRELGVRFWLGATLLEHGEWLESESRPDDARPLLAEAREIFDRLQARPWVERTDRAHGFEAVAATSDLQGHHG
ncbi:MAG: AAA family ATPase [Actinomycetota bacterium]|nr:AAA family ATPase [Actinomycetota bacterium]